MSLAFTVFETALGTGGIAWSVDGVVGIQLPEPDATKLRARLGRRFPSAVQSIPSAEVQRAIELIVEQLRGQPTDLSNIRLDMSNVDPLHQQIYAIARTIPAGQTTSYGALARRLGDEPQLARDVGQAMARNPFPIVVPCHRVLAAGGKLGGFSAAGGVATKQRLLEIERANVSWQLSLDV